MTATMKQLIDETIDKADAGARQYMMNCLTITLSTMVKYDRLDAETAQTIFILMKKSTEPED